MKKLLLGLFLASSMLFMPLTKANDPDPDPAESLHNAAAKLNAAALKFSDANTTVNQLLIEASRLLNDTAETLPVLLIPLPDPDDPTLP